MQFNQGLGLNNNGLNMQFNQGLGLNNMIPQQQMFN
jgi:hypothetical protein